jgi:hypothetical protein
MPGGSHQWRSSYLSWQLSFRCDGGSIERVSEQMCLNCGERAATSSGGKTVPLCEVCASKTSSSRGVKMTAPKPKLKIIAGGRT